MTEPSARKGWIIRNAEGEYLTSYRAWYPATLIHAWVHKAVPSRESIAAWEIQPADRAFAIFTPGEGTAKLGPWIQMLVLCAVLVAATLAPTARASGSAVLSPGGRLDIQTAAMWPADTWSFDLWIRASQDANGIVVDTGVFTMRCAGISCAAEFPIGPSLLRLDWQQFPLSVYAVRLEGEQAAGTVTVRLVRGGAAEIERVAAGHFAAPSSLMVQHDGTTGYYQVLPARLWTITGNSRIWLFEAPPLDATGLVAAWEGVGAGVVLSPGAAVGPDICWYDASVPRGMMFEDGFETGDLTRWGVRP